MSEIKVKEYIVLTDRMYTETDEWIKIDDDIAVIGITDYAQKKLKDIVGIELPEVGKSVEKGEVISVIESIKATADVYAPVSGEIVEVNEKLLDSPELMNNEPYGEGWIVKIKVKDKNELNKLLKPEEYAKKIEEREEEEKE